MLKKQLRKFLCGVVEINWPTKALMGAWRRSDPLENGLFINMATLVAKGGIRVDLSRKCEKTRNSRCSLCKRTKIPLFMGESALSARSSQTVSGWECAQTSLTDAARHYFCMLPQYVYRIYRVVPHQTNLDKKKPHDFARLLIGP